MSDEPRYSTLPQVAKAWNFPLFEAIVGRRSRRFGFGMELSTVHSRTSPIRSRCL